MSTRQRLTWRGRRASPPPAIPGYGTENVDHPATYPDPGMDDYNIGGPSEFAEDVHPGPYLNSAAPATPGYGTENMDHPAVRKEGALERQVKAKAAKCLRVASALLGPNAPASAVEDQALDLMDTPVRQLNATLKRLSGGFLAYDGTAGQIGSNWSGGKQSEDLFSDDGDFDEDDMEEEMLAEMLDDDLADDLDDDFGDDGGLDDMDEGLLAEMLDDDLDDDFDDDFDDDGDLDEIMGMLSEDDTGDEMMARWASLGFDRDGFATKRDWRGSRKVFAAIDTDQDGIITAEEYSDAMYGCDQMAEGDDDLMAGLDDEESDMLAEMLDEDMTGGMPVMASEEEDEDSEEEDEDSDEEDEDSDEEDEDSGADKEAAVFAMQSDPMGLSGSPATTPEEDVLLADIFGAKTAADDDEEEDDSEEDDSEDDDSDEDEEEKGSGKKASLRTASQRPRPRKPGRGPKTIGNLAKTASGPKEVAELSKLWASAPDVTDVFNG